MPLVDTDFCEAIKSGAWGVERGPKVLTVDDLTVNPNSVNVTLDWRLKEVTPRRRGHFWSRTFWKPYVDLHEPNSFKVRDRYCDEGGFVLKPGRLYLASVRESFFCAAPLSLDGKKCFFYPVIDGRSTPARASGLSVHCTAGRGDWGFNAPFTLELTTVLPVKVRECDELAQIYFEELSSVPTTRYEGAYVHQGGPTVASLGKSRFQRGEVSL